ncbi:MAG: class I SAM-dependent methyltransferase [Halobacteriovoraceae bacterium]|nr:class I SAM-dependent methyltransferase [Halobacteriovoraceae bacterium]
MELSQPKAEVKEFKFFNSISRKWIEFSAKHSEPTLDIGAASGVTTVLALEAGAIVIANDSNKKLLDQLSYFIPHQNLKNLTLYPGKFPDEISFKENSLGSIHIADSLEETSKAELASLFECLYSWLKPSGRLYIALPHVENYENYLAKFHVIEKSSNGLIAEKKLS